MSLFFVKVYALKHHYAYAKHSGKFCSFFRVRILVEAGTTSLCKGFVSAERSLETASLQHSNDLTK